MASDCGVCIGGSFDVELPQFYSSDIRKARKEYKCCECGRGIAKGARYEIVTGMWDGSISRYRTCLICKEIRDTFACNGGTFTELWEDVRYALFPKLTTGCLTRMQTAAAKAYLLEKWNEWKFSGQD